MNYVVGFFVMLGRAGLSPVVLDPSILDQGVEIGPTAIHFDLVCAQTMPRLPRTCPWQAELFQMSYGKQI